MPDEAGSLPPGAAAAFWGAEVVAAALVLVEAFLVEDFLVEDFLVLVEDFFLVEFVARACRPPVGAGKPALTPVGMNPVAVGNMPESPAGAAIPLKHGEG